jgi:hypothetical protein
MDITSMAVGLAVALRRTSGDDTTEREIAR